MQFHNPLWLVSLIGSATLPKLYYLGCCILWQKYLYKVDVVYYNKFCSSLALFAYSSTEAYSLWGRVWRYVCACMHMY